jgi:outer membrane protein assembly factor BamE (lipoprotein component of BamABCDE complex)
MQYRRTSLALLSLLVLLAFTGCQTVDTRIKEKPTVFASLDKTTQDMIKQGIIGIGYTEDMVYLALGSPDQIRESVTTTSRTVIWIYNSYTSYYDGIYGMGYGYGYGYPYPFYRPYAYYYGPPYGGGYHTEKEERIRVTFDSGKVTAIDQVKE